MSSSYGHLLYTPIHGLLIPGQGPGLLPFRWVIHIKVKLLEHSRSSLCYFISIKLLNVKILFT